MCERGARVTTFRADLVVVDSRDLLESLLPDHDGGEVGGVAGQHQQAEDGPQIHQETAGPALGRLQTGDGINQRGERTETTNMFLLGGDARRLSTPGSLLSDRH